MNINQGLGYLATAGIAIAILYFTKESWMAVVVAIVGFAMISDAD